MSGRSPLDVEITGGGSARGRTRGWVIRSGVARIALAGVATIAAIQWILAIAQPEGGTLGVLQVVSQHLAIAGVVLVAIAALDKRRATLVAGAALVAIVGVRFGGEWLSAPSGPPAAGLTRLTVISWNLEAGARNAPLSVAMLQAQTADVIALQELQPPAADAIEADEVLTSRYPYRVLAPRGDVLGLGLLSRVPIADATFQLTPAIQEATLDLGGGVHLGIVHAHPLHADFATLGATRLPIGIDVARRNADLELLRGRLDARSGAGAPALLLGDLNTASSEPAFGRLVRGLRDIHAEVGLGTGWTWRPSRLEFLGIGQVRIDVVIGSPTIVPISIGGSCPPVGDHCLVRAEIGVPG